MKTSWNCLINTLLKSPPEFRPGKYDVWPGSWKRTAFYWAYIPVTKMWPSPNIDPYVGNNIVEYHYLSKDVDLDDADMGRTVEQVVLRSACPVAKVTHSSGLET